MYDILPASLGVLVIRVEFSSSFIDLCCHKFILVRVQNFEISLTIIPDKQLQIVS